MIKEIVKSYIEDNIDVNDEITQSAEFIIEVEKELEELKKVSNNLNGGTMSPVSISQETLRELKYAQFVVDYQEQLISEYNKQKGENNESEEGGDE